MAETIQEAKKVKIRKEHICQGCGKKLNIGEEVTVSKYASNGTIYSFYECDVCRNYYDTICRNCKDFCDCMAENYSVGLIQECKEEAK